MGARLIVAPEAALDIAEAYGWYEDRRAGLGEEFLTSVEARLENIRRQPAAYSTVHEAYRRALIRRFPYSIFFEDEEQTVTVYAVFHTSRDPAKWRQRLP